MRILIRHSKQLRLMIAGSSLAATISRRCALHAPNVSAEREHLRCRRCVSAEAAGAARAGAHLRVDLRRGGAEAAAEFSERARAARRSFRSFPRGESPLDSRLGTKSAGGEIVTTALADNNY